MCFVSRRGEGERANRDLESIGDATPRQRLLVHVVEEVDVGAPDVLELVDQVGQRNSGEWRVRDELIFVEALDGMRVRSREPKCAIRPHALRIGHVADDLAYAPFPGCVAMIAP